MSFDDHVASQSAPAGNWVLADFTGEVISSGNGMNDLNAAMIEDQVQFVAIKVHMVDVQQNLESVRPKIARIDWVGQGVKPMQKSKALQGKEKTSSTWRGVNVNIDADCTAEMSATNLAKALLTAGAAHKPTQCRFGDVALEVKDL